MSGRRTGAALRAAGHDVLALDEDPGEWAEAGWTHAGCILVDALDHSEFALILRGIRRLFTERPRWIDLTDALTRRRASSSP